MEKHHNSQTPRVPWAVLLAGLLASAPLHAEDITWTGATNANWNITSNNWISSTSKFVQGDNVAFTDTGISVPTINVTLPVTVGTLDVSNTSGTYRFNATANSITATILNKSGAGTLEMNSTNGTPANIGTLNLSGGTISFRQQSFLVTTVNILADSTLGSLDNGSVTLAATTFSGTGNLSISPPATSGRQFQINADTSGYSGTLSIATGWLNVAGSANSLAAAKLDLTGDAQFQSYNSSTPVQIGQITAGADTFLAKGANGASTVTFEIGALNTASSIAGVIKDFGVISNGAAVTTGNVALTKVGTGTLTLSNANTYTGATVVSKGALILAAGGSIANSASLTVAEGAEFDVSAQLGGYSLGSATTLRLGDGQSALVDAGAIALTLNGALTLDFTTTVLGSYDLLEFGTSAGDFSSITLTGAFTGSLSKAGEIWTGSSGEFDLSFNEADGILTVVPEPSVIALLGLSLLTTLRRRLRAH